MYVLIFSYYDGSGITSVFGPFATEDDAESAELELRQIGISDKGEVHALRGLVPVSSIGNSQNRG